MEMVRNIRNVFTGTFEQLKKIYKIINKILP